MSALAISGGHFCSPSSFWIHWEQDWNQCLPEQLCVHSLDEP